MSYLSDRLFNKDKYSTTERFFLIILCVSILGNALALVGQINNLNPGLPYVLAGLILIDIIAYILFKKVSPNFGYHFLQFFTINLYCASNLFVENISYSGILLYPLSLTLAFYFFSNRNEVIPYVFFCLLGAGVTSVKFIQKSNLEHVDWMLETIVLVLTFFLFYLVVDFLISGLRKSRDEVLARESDLKESQGTVEAQNEKLKDNIKILEETKSDLSNKNIELEKYIESNLQLQNFAFVASHDLQAPLTSVIAFSELLQQSTSDKFTETEKRFLSSILTSANNMQSLIQALLEFSKVDSEDLSLTQLSPEKLVREVLNDISVSLEQRGATVNLKGEWPEKIVADEIKMKQLVQNLIGNGVKFSRSGVAPVVEVACSLNENDWLFSFQDNGIGIPEKSQQTIFQMFKRLHSQKEYKGTGIGLAMCRKLVEQHNGKIWLTSVPGEGTTFLVSLPHVALS